jgi:hypothetical protein
MSATLAAPKPPHPMGVLRMLKGAARRFAAAGSAGGSGSIAPPGSPSVRVTADGTPAAEKLILDFDAAQPPLHTLDATPQVIHIDLGGVTTAELAQTVAFNGNELVATIDGAPVTLKVVFSGPTANWSGSYGPDWSPKMFYDAYDVGGTFTIKKDGDNYVMSFEGQPPPASYEDCTTREQLFYWMRSRDPNANFAWEAFGLKYERDTGDGDRLAAEFTVEQAKAALRERPLSHILDANNTAEPSSSDITITHAKAADATPTDRKAVITVTFPAGLTGWCIYQGDPTKQASPPAPDGCQAKPLDGQTQATFDVTYAADGSYAPDMWVCQTWKRGPALVFP